MKYFRRILSVLIMTTGLALIASQSSLAAPVQPIVPTADPVAGMTATQFNEAIRELKESPLKRSVVTTALDTRTTFDLPEGFAMTVVEPKRASGGIQPRIGGGTDSRGVYVLFNQWDQDMLYMGSGALLGAALCAIPGVGWFACLGVSLLIGAATTAVANKGKCTNNRQLKMYVSTLQSSCV